MRLRLLNVQVVWIYLLYQTVLGQYMEKHLKMCKYRYIFKVHFLLFVLYIYSILTNGFLIYTDIDFILTFLNTPFERVFALS